MCFPESRLHKSQGIANWSYRQKVAPFWRTIIEGLITYTVVWIETPKKRLALRSRHVSGPTFIMPEFKANLRHQSRFLSCNAHAQTPFWRSTLKTERKERGSLRPYGWPKQKGTICVQRTCTPKVSQLHCPLRATAVLVFPASMSHRQEGNICLGRIIANFIYI